MLSSSNSFAGSKPYRKSVISAARCLISRSRIWKIQALWLIISYNFQVASCRLFEVNIWMWRYGRVFPRKICCSIVYKKQDRRGLKPWSTEHWRPFQGRRNTLYGRSVYDIVYDIVWYCYFVFDIVYSTILYTIWYEISYAISYTISYTI